MLVKLRSGGFQGMSCVERNLFTKKRRSVEEMVESFVRSGQIRGLCAGRRSTNAMSLRAQAKLGQEGVLQLGL